MSGLESAASGQKSLQVLNRAVSCLYWPGHHVRLKNALSDTGTGCQSSTDILHLCL